MLGIIDILCRGVSYLFVLGFRLHSVWDWPIFLGLRLFLLRKVHDVCGGLLVFCVVVYLSYPSSGISGIYSVWDLPVFLRFRLFF